MLTNVRMKISKLVLGLFTIAISVLFISSMHGVDGVRAYDQGNIKNVSNTRLGVNQIANPRVPTSADDPWNGSYVYFGQHRNSEYALVSPNVIFPVRYRVLNKDGTSVYGGLLLDCDEPLWGGSFDTPSSTSAWYYSSLLSELNGKKFYSNEEVFTEAERQSIISHYISAHDLTKIDEYAMGWFHKFVGMTRGEKVFVLDAEDMLNPSYGYWREAGFDGAEHYVVKNRLKLNSNNIYQNYWLRSMYGSASDKLAGVVSYDGYLDGIGPNAGAGIAPALSVDLSKILFSTAIKGTYGSLGTEYKLTVIDPELNISLREGGKTSISGRTVSIPYTVAQISGRDCNYPDQMSVMILDKPYTDGNTNNSKILYYGAASEYCTASDAATFDVPSNFDLNKWGKEYYVYFFVEYFARTKHYNVNLDQLSDYASVPVKLARPSDYTTQIDFRSEYTIELDKRQGDACYYLLTNGMVKASRIENNTVRFDLDGDGIYDCIFYTSSDGISRASRFTNSPISDKYTYDVSNCSGSYLHRVQFLFAKPKPPAPTGLKGSADTSTSVKLTWNKEIYADEYEVYRATSANGTYSKLGSVTETNRRCPGLTAGTKYYFKVRSVMIINSIKYYSDFTSPISVVPPLTAPGGVKATVSSNTAVTVSWDAVKGAKGYVVYRSTSQNGTYTRLGTVTVTSRKCTGLTGGKKYYFKVRAIVTYDGTTYYGKFSSPVFAVPTLPKPSYVSVTYGGSSGSAVVYWNPVSNASAYVIYRSTSENGTYTRLGTVSDTNRKCTGLKKGQTYYFKVRAITVIDGTTYYGSFSTPVKYTAK